MINIQHLYGIIILTNFFFYWLIFKSERQLFKLRYNNNILHIKMYILFLFWINLRYIYINVCNVSNIKLIVLTFKYCTLSYFCVV